MRSAVLALLLAVACDRHDKAVPAPATSSPAAPPSADPWAAKEPPRVRDLVAARAAHAVHGSGPSPQDYDNTPPPGVEVLHYTSAGRELLAWYAKPAGKGKAPGMVYFHGGFALGADDARDVQAFAKAGFAVLFPTLRGENGNPGEYEMGYGEVDDARAAVAWLRARPEVDAAHVYAFGHSAGGIVSALLSMYPDTGVRLAGSVGGMYDAEVIGIIGVAGDQEQLLRAPANSADQLKVPHVAYAGLDDPLSLRSVALAEVRAAETRAPLTVVRVTGDHQTSLPAAVEDFLARARADLGPR